MVIRFSPVVIPFINASPDLALEDPPATADKHPSDPKLLINQVDQKQSVSLAGAATCLVRSEEGPD